MTDQATQGLLSPFLQTKRIEAARELIRGKVLDLGCGNGALARFVPRGAYFGVDRDENSLSVAQSTYPEHIFSPQVPDHGDFDTIVALAFIEHLPDPASQIGTWRDRLAPDGQIVLTTPHRSFRKVHEIGSLLGLFSRHAAEEHETLFDYESLNSIAKDNGLRVERYERFLFGANQLCVMTRADA